MIQVNVVNKKNSRSRREGRRLLEQPGEGNGSDSLSMRLGGFAGWPGPLGFAHAFGGGSDRLSQRSILNFARRPN